ncbi:hypothetical protein KP509_23G035900 [Ceratopteris richardii]|uniref:Transmembrane protein n=1 Tax=Ceratopteris richardii TaxID=49495 RepID=A0A8T2S133_CERRI|nr:hypothetical protein KP509_23G035900 [Ceratopteris richardii]
MSSVCALRISLVFLWLASLRCSLSGGALQSSPPFDDFVLFGQIHTFSFMKAVSCRPRLFVELGGRVWIHDLESQYYIFHLPVMNYSEMKGQLSLIACDQSPTKLWSKPFSVQSDVGACRLDIFDSAQNYIAQKGKTLQNVIELNSTHLFEKDIGETFHKAERLSPDARAKFTSKVFLKMPHGARPHLKEQVYRNKAKWSINFVVVIFAFISLLIAVLHKDISVSETTVSAGDDATSESARSSEQDLAAWQLWMRNNTDADGYSFDSSYGNDFPYADEDWLENAWTAAEQYLKDAIENTCHGAYFSYNCTVPQQGTPEPAMGRWNRDNAGRLIRQLWS